jgi:hypothetical protein
LAATTFPGELELAGKTKPLFVHPVEIKKENKGQNLTQ